MTGTSMDALDAALVRIAGTGLEMTATFVRGVTEPFRSLAWALRPVASQAPCSARALRRLAARLGAIHVRGLRRLIGTEASKVDLIALHGQTVYHEPGLSLQLMDPWSVAAALRRPVVFDLRGADTACGGQGAPITPLADHVLFRRTGQTIAVVNLGGFINFTRLPPHKPDSSGAAALRAIRAGDICPCNQLLDAIARRCFKRPYDQGGRRARTGRVIENALDALTRELGRQARRGASLGTGDEALTWLDTFARRHRGADLARTACVAIARTVAGRLGGVDRVLVAGGGSRNAALMQELGRALPVPVEPTDAHGVPAAYREAIALAVLGALSQDRVPITLPQVTGCENPIVAGAWIAP